MTLVSSGFGQSIFETIAPASVIVGFDADARGQDDNFAEGFAKSHLVTSAVTEKEDAETVSFILTQYPSSSSTLEPDLKALEDYSFHDYFIPVRRTEVPATTLRKVLGELGYEAFDWIKVDSQGIDMRLLQSLPEQAFNNLLAVDIEPGVIKAYVGEDMFVDTHNYLFGEGYWLADILLPAYARASKDGLAKLQEITGKEDVIPSLVKSPTAAEARYFRNNAFYRSPEATHRQFVIAMVFALADDKAGFAADLLHIFEQRFAGDALIEPIRNMIRSLVMEGPPPERSIRASLLRRARRLRSRFAILNDD